MTALNFICGFMLAIAWAFFTLLGVAYSVYWLHTQYLRWRKKREREFIAFEKARMRQSAQRDMAEYIARHDAFYKTTREEELYKFYLRNYKPGQLIHGTEYEQIIVETTMKAEKHADDELSYRVMEGHETPKHTDQFYPLNGSTWVDDSVTDGTRTCDSWHEVPHRRPITPYRATIDGEEWWLRDLDVGETIRVGDWWKKYSIFVFSCVGDRLNKTTESACQRKITRFKPFDKAIEQTGWKAKEKAMKDEPRITKEDCEEAAKVWEEKKRYLRVEGSGLKLIGRLAITPENCPLCVKLGYTDDKSNAVCSSSCISGLCHGGLLAKVADAMEAGDIPRTLKAMDAVIDRIREFGKGLEVEETHSLQDSFQSDSTGDIFRVVRAGVLPEHNYCLIIVKPSHRHGFTYTGSCVARIADWRAITDAELSRIANVSNWRDYFTKLTDKAK